MNSSHKNGKSIAIMQPTFLPWIGYFALIDCVEQFVYLDHVQFEKRSWQQRNRIKTTQQVMWVSVPVYTKGKQKQMIKDVEIVYEDNKSPLDKIFKSIELSYKKAPFYQDYIDGIGSFFMQRTKYISDLNQDIIQWSCQQLGITTPCVRSSELKVAESKDDLLVNICQVLQATHYISPPGSKVYLEQSNAFERAGISLSYHQYNHPEYSQIHGNFAPFLCILDLLFNEGPKSGEVMRMGLCND